MNTFNRILIAAATLVLMIVCALVLVAAIPILRLIVGGLSSLLITLEGAPRVLVYGLGVFFALAWIILCILFLIFELRPSRPRLIRVQQVGGGEALVSLRTIGEHIAYAVDQLPGVLRTLSRIAAHREGVTIELEVDTAGDVEIPAQAARIVELVRTVAEEKVGVKLARPPRVHLRASPLPPSPKPVAVRQPEVQTISNGQ